LNTQPRRLHLLSLHPTSPTTISPLSLHDALPIFSLGGLSRQDVAAYVELTASEIASPELVAALHEETEGNPLFVAETVRLLSLEDRKSTRLNSSHVAISYAVFCLKKKRYSRRASR